MDPRDSIYYIEGFSNVTNRYFESIKQGIIPQNSSYVDYIKREIYEGGPVTVSIDACEPLELYKDGILDVKKDDIQLNHLIHICGYGEENGIPYWLIQNSWGTNWGIGGRCKIRMGTNCLGLEQITGDPNNINYIYAAYPKGWAALTGNDVTNQNVA